MPLALILVLAVVAIVLVAAFVLGGGAAAKTRASRRTTVHDELADRADTLDYEVPRGQDPALLVAALRQDGYDAAPDPRRTNLLHIECPSGPDRERPRVRATLESVRHTVMDTGAPVDPEPVRFADEA